MLQHVAAVVLSIASPEISVPPWLAITYGIVLVVGGALTAAAQVRWSRAQKEALQGQVTLARDALAERDKRIEDLRWWAQQDLKARFEAILAEQTSENAALTSELEKQHEIAINLQAQIDANEGDIQAKRAELAKAEMRIAALEKIVVVLPSTATSAAPGQGIGLTHSSTRYTIYALRKMSQRSISPANIEWVLEHHSETRQELLLIDLDDDRPLGFSRVKNSPLQAQLGSADSAQTDPLGTLLGSWYEKYTVYVGEVDDRRLEVWTDDPPFLLSSIAGHRVLTARWTAVSPSGTE